MQRYSPTNTFRKNILFELKGLQNWSLFHLIRKIDFYDHTKYFLYAIVLCEKAKQLKLVLLFYWNKIYAIAAWKNAHHHSTSSRKLKHVLLVSICPKRSFYEKNKLTVEKNDKKYFNSLENDFLYSLLVQKPCTFFWHRSFWVLDPSLLKLLQTVGSFVSSAELDTRTGN